MAKIKRFTGNLKAFASNALLGERTLFGPTAAESDVIDDNINADFLRGWGIVPGNEAPALEDYNALGFTISQILAYLHQMGIPEYDPGQEYYIGSVATYAGLAYRSTADNNIGSAPNLLVNWAGLAEAPSFEWVGAEQTGGELVISGGDRPAIADLDGTNVAIVSGANRELRTCHWDGSIWTQVGNTLNLGAVGFVRIVSISSSLIALVSDSSNTLRTIGWDGNNWSQVGNALPVSAGVSFDLAAINGTDIAYVDAGSDELKAYRWDGNDWTQIGNTFSITIGGDVSISTLTENTIACINRSTTELRTISWNGSDWAQVGNSNALPGLSPVGATMAALNTTDIAVALSRGDELRTYRWDGLDWTQSGVATGTGNYNVDLEFDMVALNGSHVAYIDVADLKTYRFDFSIGSPYRP